MTEQPLALDLKGLTKQFGTRKAVNALNLQLPTGAFLSVFGPNGAGKTTLLRLLAGLARPTAGTALVCGLDVREQPEELRARLGLVSHQPLVYPDLNALENLEFYGRLYGVPRPRERALELLEAVGLKNRRLDAVKTFSRGMTQRLTIARALVNDPALILLDEPYSGLDPHAAQVLDRLLAEVRPGRTFVMVSHDLAKGHELATHLLVMERGRLAHFAPRSELSLDELRACYLDVAGAA